MVLTVFPRTSYVRLAAVLGLLCAACGGRKDEFLQGRSLDLCNESWPVCSGFAGCLMGPQSYTGGRFPGDSSFIVQVAEPSLVRVSFYVENVSAAGTETWIRFHEDRCRTNIKVTFEGRDFVGESERLGAVTREADLTGLGDHLIEFKSDADLDYAVKADVIPKRLVGGE